MILAKYSIVPAILLAGVFAKQREKSGETKYSLLVMVLILALLIVSLVLLLLWK